MIKIFKCIAIHTFCRIIFETDTVLARMDDSPFILYLLLMTQIVTCYSLLHKLSDLLEVCAYKPFALE